MAMVVLVITSKRIRAFNNQWMAANTGVEFTLMSSEPAACAGRPETENGPCIMVIPTVELGCCKGTETIPKS